MSTAIDHYHIHKNHNLFLFSMSLIFLFPLSSAAAPVGVCYGRVANNLPSPPSVVTLLKSNKISHVRLFNTDPDTLTSFAASGIKLMIGVPNEILPNLTSGGITASLDWLHSNIFVHVPPENVGYIAVGNEILLKDPYYTPYIIPVILNLYQALQSLHLESEIKLSSPQVASILSHSYPPSSGTFDPRFYSTLIPLLQFLQNTQSVFMINVYPYISYTNNRNYISLDYALFRSKDRVQDGEFVYENLYDSSIDAFVYAMEREGFSQVPVVVAETGWPTSGGEAASTENALIYNSNVVRRASDDVGTPRRPGKGVEVYLFDLFDENGKGGEEYERHFGLFGIDGIKAYNISFR